MLEVKVRVEVTEVIDLTLTFDRVPDTDELDNAIEDARSDLEERAIENRNVHINYEVLNQDFKSQRQAVNFRRTGSPAVEFIKAGDPFRLAVKTPV